MNVYGQICTFGLLSVVLLVATTVQCSTIHERMTDDEIANLFHTTRDDMPEYEVVSVMHNRYKRSSQNLHLQFTAFGEKIDAYLHPSDGKLMGADTPVWIAYTTPDGKVEYKKLRKGIVGDVISSFINPTNLSTVAVHQPSGKRPSFNGVFNAYRLHSLPERFQEEVRSKRNSEAFNATRTMLETHYHVVIKSKSPMEDDQIRGLEKQISETSPSGDSDETSRVKRTDQEIIYPSLLVQTDYKGTKPNLHDDQYSEDILYQIAFWNAVDMRYRSVDNPKIRLRIAGLIIGGEPAAIPYLQNHRTGDEVDIGPALEEAISYWYKMRLHKDFPHNSYDIIVTITDSNMEYLGNQLQGLAAQSYSCRHQSSDMYHAVTAVRDKGGYDGIIPAAHELGHIFGMYHDTLSTHDECSNGFIMAPRNKATVNNLRWSKCSLRSLAYFMRNPNVVCYDKPDEYHPSGDSVQRLLPGDVWGADAQCRARGFADACKPNQDMCTLMQCTHDKPYVSGSTCIKVGPAAEGTRCAPGHKCVDGVCQCMTKDCIYVDP